MDIGVRLRPPNPRAFCESEEKKVGASGESRSKCAKIIKIYGKMGTFGDNFVTKYGVFG